MPLPEYFEPTTPTSDWHRNGAVGGAGHYGLGGPGDGPQFRPGAYVCQCPAGLPRLKPTHNQRASGSRGSTQANQEQLIGLFESQTTTTEQPSEPSSAPTSSLASGGQSPDEQLARRGLLTIGDDNGGPSRFRLNDKQAIAELLLARDTQARLRPTTSGHLNWTPSLPNNNNKSTGSHASGGPHSSESLLLQRRPRFRSFVLGAELESAVALSMLAGSTRQDDHPDDNVGEPQPLGPQPFGLSERACRACDSEAADETETANQIECPPGTSDSDEDQHENQHSGLNWLRLLVLVSQLVCIVVTLALIGIILRIRKSRVSSIAPSKSSVEQYGGWPI